MTTDVSLQALARAADRAQRAGLALDNVLSRQ